MYVCIQRQRETERERELLNIELPRAIDRQVRVLKIKLNFLWYQRYALKK